MTNKNRGKATALAAFVTLMGSVGRSGAATLTTGLINGAAGPGGMLCTAVNAGTKDVDVTIELFDPVGNRVSGTAPTIVPGHAFALGVPNDVGYCRFVFRGAKNQVRGTACSSVDGGCTTYLEAR